MTSVADEIIQIFTVKGETAYYGEEVSQLEHALQAAQSALRDRADTPLVVAALVHDIGHLLDNAPEDVADHGIDARHEESGHQWLAARFEKNVYEPVHLHVCAKRYLCATDPAYFGRLSIASVHSLVLQGGPMTPAEVSAFETNEFYREAVALRRWDDEAKIPGLTVKPLNHYRELLNSAAKS